MALVLKIFGGQWAFSGYILVCLLLPAPLLGPSGSRRRAPLADTYPGGLAYFGASPSVPAGKGRGGAGRPPEDRAGRTGGAPRDASRSLATPPRPCWTIRAGAARLIPGAHAESKGNPRKRRQEWGKQRKKMEDTKRTRPLKHLSKAHELTETEAAGPGPAQVLALCYVSLRELPICHRACEPASVTPPWPWMSLLLQPGPESPTRLLTCEALYLAHGHKGYPQVAKFHSLRSNQLRYIRYYGASGAIWEKLRILKDGASLDEVNRRGGLLDFEVSPASINSLPSDYGL
ncbi:uncharacterized protein LOC127689723 [Apodemus sylvaticus]|uniref:uncharacterized protein LOC127689723 n=1 Tax=Apodemus sylvaticus TaxID=10129 RepID=UPI002244B489|nr:uncharacterized protein LOC127689723 [Apodemus sylvaticus]